MTKEIEKLRYLRPLKLGRKSTNFFVFDVETGIMDEDGNIEYILSARPEHFLFAVVYGIFNEKETYRVFNTPRELQYEFLQGKYKNKIIYAHNAEYDLSATFGNIYHLDNRACFNGKFISCTNGNAKFADSYNILPTSVEKLGELLGLAKLELGDNLRSHLSRRDRDVEYCVRDCAIVYKSLQKIFAETEPSYTIGSLSLKLFRKEFLQDTIKVHPLADEFFDATYGGRTECYRIGECKARVYDINSAYPDAMAKLRFPDPFNLREYKITDAMSIIKNVNMEGMISAKVRVLDTHVPPLPWRFENKLLFPVGEFSGSWCLNEFRFALRSGNIESFEPTRIIAGPYIESPFEKFITTLYDKRSASTNEFQRYYLKLFMNNLYGKLIQRSHEDYIFCDTEEMAVKRFFELKGANAELLKVAGGYFLRYYTEKRYSHTIAPFGAYITAHVRVKLATAMKKYADSLVYADTDSIAIEQDVAHTSNKLGEWKRENKIITRVRALKDYEFFDEEKLETGQMLKGVKKNAKQLDLDANAFTYKRMIRTRESFMRVDNLPPGTFIEQMKLVRGTYTKRKVLRNGETRPFFIKDQLLK
jgi:hypothetical protein